MRNQRDEPAVSFAITNIASDLDLDCNEAYAEAGFLKLQDNVGCIVQALQNAGILAGTAA